MARPFEVPALRPASSVRSDEVWLGVGSRHRELGGADIDGPDCAGTGKETEIDPRQRTRKGFASESRCSLIERAWKAGGTRATPLSTAFLCGHTSMRPRSHLPRYEPTIIADSPRFSDLDLGSDRLRFTVQPGMGDPGRSRI